jgi:pimeloyl-ACP methyl ester carboxylesterase
MSAIGRQHDEGLVHIGVDGATLDGNLLVPKNAKGIVVFAHGSGSSRFSSRNRYVAERLRASALGTLLLDLLTPAEEDVDVHTRQHRFDIDLLSERLIGTAGWLCEQLDCGHLPVGLFGASTGAAAALVAAAEMPEHVRAVVSRGGRPDLAGAALTRVVAPTLLIVGGNDIPVIELNQSAHQQMTCERRIEIIPGATHLFEEPGALDRVADLAGEWFRRHL